MIDNIIIGSGGFMLSYFMGVFHYILLKYGTNQFKNIHISGASAGGHLAGYAIASINNVYDMKFWHENGPKYTVKYTPVKFRVFTRLLKLAGERYYNIIQTKLDTIESIDFIYKNYSCYGTKLNSDLYVIKNIKSSKDFGNAMACTGNIPFFGSFYRWKYNDTYLWDGGVAFNLYPKEVLKNKKNSVLFCINKYQYKETNNLKIIEFSKWRKLLVDNGLHYMFLSSDDASNKMDYLFNLGFNDAKDNHIEIENKLGLNTYSNL